MKNPSTSHGRIGVYCRISRDPEGRAEGVETQERRGREYAATHWPDAPVVVFVDNDISAANGAPRPGFDDLVAAIRRGEIGELVCAEQSRLTRRPAEWEDLVVTLAKAGIGEMHTYRKGTVNVGGSKLVGRIMSAVDAEEVERLKARILDKHDALAAQGRPSGGWSYGYRSVKNARGEAALEQIPEQAAAARWMADKVLSGWSLANVARELEARGAPTRRGGRWSPTTVRSILSSPTIAGLRVHRRTGQTSEGTWEGIIDPSTWRQVDAVLKAIAKGRAPKRTNRRYLLTAGIARCGKCGAPLIAARRDYHSRRGARAAYLCHRQPDRPDSGCNGIGIGAEGLEQHVVDTLLDELDRPAFWASMASDEHDHQRGELTRALTVIEERRGDLARRWGTGSLSSGEWDVARATLDDEQSRLQAELADVPAPLVDVDPELIKEGWHAMHLSERRQLITLFVEKVVVHAATPGTRRFDPDRVEIVWRML